MDDIKPDIVVLHNLHSNYINLKLLLGYLADHHIASICVLHDCWLFTGKCMHFIEFDCNRWTKKCGKCPAKHNGNTSFFFDKSSKCLTDKKKYFEKIDRLGVIAVSKWVAESAAGSILKGAAMIRHIYNWIDLEIFRPQSCKNFWGGGDYQIRESFIIFGISAGWSASKGIDVLTELADILPADCRIVLAGDVSEVSETNNKIKLLGTVTDIDLLAKMYAMSDVFVNPSIQETFGLTTAEALACGTPVVAYNATANTELVGTDESCGFLVDENKAENYLQNILKIKEKSKEYYAAAARKRAEEMFCKDKNIRQYIDTFKSLLAM